MTSRTGSIWRIWGFWKSQLVELRFCLGRRRLAFARLPKPGLWPLWRMPHEVGGGDWWKSQNRKNVYLSPYVEEPLNSKVIKSFVPEQRSRKCFSCFEIPMFYVIYIWTLYVVDELITPTLSSAGQEWRHIGTDVERDTKKAVLSSLLDDYHY